MCQSTAGMIAPWDVVDEHKEEDSMLPVIRSDNGTDTGENNLENIIAQ